jgi:hypothetical protein
VEYDPVVVALEPTFIGTAARNDFQWQYRPVGPYGTNIELSSENPPVHKATYRIYLSDTPESIKVVVQVVFRKQGKLGRTKASNVSAAFRILRDLQAMHIITRLEVKVGNELNDWFTFPGQSKEGCRLHSKIRFDKGKLVVGKADELGSGALVSRLNCAVSKALCDK